MNPAIIIFTEKNSNRKTSEYYLRIQIIISNHFGGTKINGQFVTFKTSCKIWSQLWEPKKKEKKPFWEYS